MAQDPDEERIRRKAHELWEAEGHPHGRDADHWDKARELIAIHDSQTSTLLPREFGAEEPVESEVLRESYGDVPTLTDQGPSGLTDTSREPGAMTPSSINPMTSDAINADARAGAQPKPVAKQPAAVKKPLAETKPIAPPPKAAAAKVAAPVESVTKSAKPPAKPVAAKKK